MMISKKKKKTCSSDRSILNYSKNTTNEQMKANEEVYPSRTLYPTENNNIFESIIDKCCRRRIVMD